MGLLNKLFGKSNPKRDRLMDRADNLVAAANTQAIGTFIPLLDRHPVLREVDVQHWDFIVTVAGVFLAATRLNSIGLEPSREEALMEVVARRLNEWDPNGIRAFEDCKGLFESEYDRLRSAGHEKAFLGSDPLGIWIVSNALGRQARDEEEVGLVREIGILVTSGLYDWWS